MRDFRKGDEVKWSYEFSILTHYGKVMIVRKNSCTVLVSGPEGQTSKVNVPKRMLNFD
jgi:hypothetical protein